MSSAQVSLALEEGRLADAAETHAGFVDCVPGDKRSALPPPRHRPRRGPWRPRARRPAVRRAARVAAAATTRRRRSTTSSLLVEHLLTLGIDTGRRARPRDRRLAGRRTRRTRRSAPTPTGCWRWRRATTTVPPMALAAVLADARPVPRQAGHRLVAHGAGRGAARGRRPGRGAGGDPPGARRRPRALAGRAQGPRRGAGPPPAGRVDPRRRRAHGAGARGRRPARRRPDERAARRAPVHLAEDRRRPRLQHPRQARPVDPGRDRRLGRPPRRRPVERSATRWSLLAVLQRRRSAYRTLGCAEGRIGLDDVRSGTWVRWWRSRRSRARRRGSCASS